MAMCLLDTMKSRHGKRTQDKRDIKKVKKIKFGVTIWNEINNTYIINNNNIFIFPFVLWQFLSNQNRATYVVVVWNLVGQTSRNQGFATRFLNYLQSLFEA